MSQPNVNAGTKEACPRPTEGTPDARSKSGRRVWPWIVGVGGLLVFLAGTALCALVGLSLNAQMPSDPSGWTARSGEAVGLIYIEGTIGAGIPGAAGAVDTEAILNYVRQAEANRRVKAIVVYINSPGGAPLPADLMYRALRDATKPVVVAMGDVAASGGYYIAAGAERIYAHPATITGSIAVYGRLLNAAQLFETLGVEGIIVRSGASKAIGNVFERPTEEQLAIEQGIVDELHDLFVRSVAEGRGMDEQKVRELADGRPYTAKQALELGLIDEIGTLSDAIEGAARMGEIAGEPQIIEYKRAPTLLEVWMGALSSRQGGAALQEWLDPQWALPQMRYFGR
jgi:protease-4